MLEPIPRDIIERAPSSLKGPIWAFGGSAPCLWVPQQCSEDFRGTSQYCQNPSYVFFCTRTWSKNPLPLSFVPTQAVTTMPIYNWTQWNTTKYPSSHFTVSRNVLWGDYLVLCPQIDFYWILHRFPQKEHPPVFEVERLEYNAVWLVQSK